jgi:hypothetical protein
MRTRFLAAFVFAIAIAAPAQAQSFFGHGVQPQAKSQRIAAPAYTLQPVTYWDDGRPYLRHHDRWRGDRYYGRGWGWSDHYRPAPRFRWHDSDWRRGDWREHHRRDRHWRRDRWDDRDWRRWR